jgi:chitodextrinase
MTIVLGISSRMSLGALVSVAMFCVVLALGLTAEEADAWETVSTQSMNGDCGYAYKYTSSSSGSYYYKYTTSTPYLGYYGYRSTSGYTVTYWYEPWYNMPINLVESKAYIDSATLTIRTTGYTLNQNVQAKFLSLDPTTTSSAVTVYNDIRSTSGAVIGTLRIAGPGTYTFTFSQTALTHLRNSVQAGNMNAWIGFAMTTEPAIPSGAGSYYYRQYLYANRVTMTWKVDRAPPNVPTMSSLPTWTLGSSLTAQWSAVTDMPAGGSRGGVEYSARLQYQEDGAWVTHRLPPWTSSTSATFTNLIDGGHYRVQVQSRDASDYRSAWSTAVMTSVDASPPTIPILKALLEYTSGSTLSVRWSASTDAGIGLGTGPPGVYPYELQWSLSPTFATYWSKNVLGTSTSVSGLEDNTQYFYRVRAQDKAAQQSGWSPIESTIMDDDPPSIPMIWEEAEYTPGTTNMFNWHASSDAGVGLRDYYVQVATDDTFRLSNRVVDTFTVATFFEATGLADGTTYYCRVASRDHFDHISVWSQVVSSTQDASGPSAPVVNALPPYSPAGAITLTWEGSSDEGAGLGWYKVMVSKDPDFGQVDKVYDRVMGESWDHVETGSHCQTLYMRVVPVDLLGNEGLSSDANTTMDTVAPEAPTIDPLPPFTPDEELTLEWSVSMDNGSGVDHYVVHVLPRPGSGPIHTGTTNTTSLRISDLTDGVRYWYRVTAVDMAGNANMSDLASSTQDASPPTRPFLEALPDLTPGDSVTVRWEPSVDAGVGGLEYQVAWSTGLSPESSEDGIVGTSFEVTGLTDGTTYNFWVRSRDAFGHVGHWSPRSSTTMDASPPGVPTMNPLPEFLPGPIITVSWATVTDGSGLQVQYRVSVYDDPQATGNPVARSPWLPETRYDLWGLDTDTALYFRAESRDPFGWTSALSEPSSTTMDAAGPSGQVIDDLPEFSPGTGLLVTWSAAVDAGCGGIEYRLVTYADEELKVPVHMSPWVETLGTKLVSLNEGETQWFVVECRDGFGNVGPDSEPASTTMDATPPILQVDAPGIFGPDDEAARGTVSDATSGVASVETSSDGGVTWEAAEMQDGGWSMAFPSSSWSGELLVRATDVAGNTGLTPITAVVDQTDPTVNIVSPADGSDVFGPTAILGFVFDDHLETYTVEYSGGEGGDWSFVQLPQATSGMSGTLATWMTSGLPGGKYTLRVTATDAMENTGRTYVTVTLMGAHLTLSPADITFSDSRPLPGDKIDVMVTVRNSGDSPAEDVTVTLSTVTGVVDERTGITVPAHGNYIAIFSVKAEEGGMELSARASSSLYDTGQMTSGKPLNTMEEEGVLENVGGVLGIIALILAVMVLAILLVSRIGKGKEEEPVMEPEPEVVVLDPLEDTEGTS